MMKLHEQFGMQREDFVNWAEDLYSHNLFEGIEHRDFLRAIEENAFSWEYTVVKKVFERLLFNPQSDPTGTLVKNAVFFSNPEEKLSIQLPNMIHLRPAAKIQKIAARHPDTNLYIHWQGRKVNTVSIMDIVGLAIPRTEVTFTASGPRRKEALREVRELVEAANSAIWVEPEKKKITPSITPYKDMDKGKTKPSNTNIYELLTKAKDHRLSVHKIDDISHLQRIVTLSMENQDFEGTPFWIDPELSTIIFPRNPKNIHNSILKRIKEQIDSSIADNFIAGFIILQRDGDVIQTISMEIPKSYINYATLKSHSADPASVRPALDKAFSPYKHTLTVHEGGINVSFDASDLLEKLNISPNALERPNAIEEKRLHPLKLKFASEDDIDFKQATIQRPISNAVIIKLMKSPELYANAKLFIGHSEERLVEAGTSILSLILLNLKEGDAITLGVSGEENAAKALLKYAFDIFGMEEETGSGTNNDGLPPATPSGTMNSSAGNTPQETSGASGTNASSAERSTGFAGFFDIETDDPQNLGAQHLIEGDDGNACIDPTLLPAGSGQYYFMPNMFPIQSVTPTSRSINS